MSPIFTALILVADAIALPRAVDPAVGLLEALQSVPGVERVLRADRLSAPSALMNRERTIGCTMLYAVIARKE